jgi:hypothetical protein
MKKRLGERIIGFGSEEVMRRVDRRVPNTWDATSSLVLVTLRGHGFAAQRQFALEPGREKSTVHMATRRSFVTAGGQLSPTDAISEVRRPGPWRGPEEPWRQIDPARRNLRTARINALKPLYRMHQLRATRMTSATPSCGTERGRAPTCDPGMAHEPGRTERQLCGVSCRVSFVQIGPITCGVERAHRTGAGASEAGFIARTRSAPGDGGLQPPTPGSWLTGPRQRPSSAICPGSTHPGGPARAGETPNRSGLRQQMSRCAVMADPPARRTRTRRPRLSQPGAQAPCPRSER